jgi:hypothetical protein
MDGSFKAAIDLSRSWAASLEQMNKGETGQSNGEKTTSAKKKFKTVDATTARRCLRSVGFRGSSQALLSVKTAALTSVLITPFRSSLNWTK